MRWRYEDFDLRLESDREGLTVRLVRSLCGTTSAPFQPPFEPTELDQVWTGLEEAVRGSGSSPESSSDDARMLGERLFVSLLQGEVALRLRGCAAAVQARDGVGLRIRLQFDPTDRAAFAWASLPWELLADPATGAFLAQRLSATVVRTLDVFSPVHAEPTTLPLRVLVVLASPHGLPTLGVAEERRRIEDAWGTQPDVELCFIDDGRIETMRARLRAEPHHVLHFVGHGSFNERSGAGTLAFVAPDGGPQAVDARTFAATLDGCAGLRLVWLNSCHGAALPRRAGQHPFSNVAASLVASGLPAVLAMQFALADDDGPRLAGAFYAALAAGDPLDAALVEGRLALAQAGRDSLAWIAPALYLAPGAEAALTLPPAQRRPAAMSALEQAVELLAPMPEEAYRLAARCCNQPPTGREAHLVAAAALVASRPINALPPTEREALLRHLRVARGGPPSPLAEMLATRLAAYYHDHGRAAPFPAPSAGWRQEIASKPAELESRVYAALLKHEHVATFTRGAD